MHRNQRSNHGSVRSRVSDIARMSEGQVTETAASSSKGRPAKKAPKSGFFARIALFFRQVIGELKKVVGDPAMKERFVNIGFDPTPISSEEAAAIMRKTSEAWAPVIKRLNIKLD